MTTTTYTTPTNWVEFTVPADVQTISVDVRGAGAQGRVGGRVIGNVSVAPGQTFYIMVGQEGKRASGKTAGGTAIGGGGHGGTGGINASGSLNGGDGGGGASAIRRDNPDTGPLIAVAAGAGGRSGDGGYGGDGGSGTGESGRKAHLDPSSYAVVPTGGTQAHSGNAGYNRQNPGVNGERATDDFLALAGRGGQQINASTHGGGGGGGGYRAGAGGAASWLTAPGTGGSGGSNFTGLLWQQYSFRGTGNVSHGSVTLTYVTAPELNLPPSAPSDAYVNGAPEADDLPTRATTIVIDAVLSDPNPNDTLRMIAQVSPTREFQNFITVTSGYVSAGERAAVTLTALSPNTHYYVRLFSQDAFGLVSIEHNSVNFWTNRPPDPPQLLGPAENSVEAAGAAVTFSWKFIDPDGDDDGQGGFRIRTRLAATTLTPASDWVVADFGETAATTASYAGREPFAENVSYDWAIQTRDVGGLWGEWSIPSSWFSLGPTFPPIPLSPTHGSAVEVGAVSLFQWRFVDGTPGDYQIKADIRYRLVGQDDDQWVVVFGGAGAVGVDSEGRPIDINGNITTSVPGVNPWWDLPADLFEPTYHYEWQVRTTDNSAATSEWSVSSDFWAVSLVPRPVAAVTGVPKGALGCGEHRVFVYQRGGQVLVGEITPIATLAYSRQRDDISSCLIRTNGFGTDCGQLFSDLRCWMHEVVVFRDGKRVWEGPITRIALQANDVEVEAKDCMAYLYRRIMRQGYNDSYKMVNGRQMGLATVVDRAAQIIMSAMAPYDANLLPFLTPLRYAGDARTSRVVADYTKTAWEEVDDLAATAGLDYVTVGRRIILNDVHRPIGRLPELRDKDFADSPIVTEYGMQLANYFAVSSSDGVWGAVQRPEGFDPYGPIEMLASAYGEEEGATNEVLTSAGRAQKVKVLTSQAERGMGDRWPTPLVVRVPDNSALSADAPVTMDQLIPGVWIPVYASGLRPVAQWQKLDSVKVEVDADSEAVMVVMSPAPNGGADPDADDTATEDES